MGDGSLEFTVNMYGLEELVKAVHKLGDVDKKARKDFKRAANRAATLGISEIQKRIHDTEKPFVFKRSEGSPTTSQPGQLRKSIKVWPVSPKSFGVFLGVRRGKKAKAGADGWYAWVVEHGHVGGKDRSKGGRRFFEEGSNRAEERIRAAYRKNLTAAYNRYITRINGSG